MEPKGVPPQQRLRKFPGGHLTVSSVKLFCTAHRAQIRLTSSGMKTHPRSAKLKLYAANILYLITFCIQNSGHNESNSEHNVKRNRSIMKDFEGELRNRVMHKKWSIINSSLSAGTSLWGNSFSWSGKRKLHSYTVVSFIKYTQS